jgi:hypothetical protein
MKLSNMIFIVIGLEILLWLAGINTSMGTALTALNIQNPALISTSWLFTKAAYILAIGGTALVVVGFFTKSSTENALIAVVAGFFLKMVGDFAAIIAITNSYCEAFTQPYSSCAWITWIVVALVVPMMVVFVMAALDWWRGRD